MDTNHTPGARYLRSMKRCHVSSLARCGSAGASVYSVLAMPRGTIELESEVREWLEGISTESSLQQRSTSIFSLNVAASW